MHCVWRLHIEVTYRMGDGWLIGQVCNGTGICFPTPRNDISFVPTFTMHFSHVIPSGMQRFQHPILRNFKLKVNNLMNSVRNKIKFALQSSTRVPGRVPRWRTIRISLGAIEWNNTQIGFIRTLARTIHIICVRVDGMLYIVNQKPYPLVIPHSIKNNVLRV